MAELASSVTVFSEAKKKMVDSVSNVLEDEFQCSICNELFITVSIISLIFIDVQKTLAVIYPNITDDSYNEWPLTTTITQMYQIKSVTFEKNLVGC